MAIFNSFLLVHQRVGLALFDGTPNQPDRMADGSDIADPRDVGEIVHSKPSKRMSSGEDVIIGISATGQLWVDIPIPCVWICGIDITYQMKSGLVDE